MDTGSDAKYDMMSPSLLQVASCTLLSTALPVEALQRFVARSAAAIHAADPSARVTVGSHSLPYVSDAGALKGIDAFEPRPRSLFSDQALKAASSVGARGGREDCACERSAAPAAGAGTTDGVGGGAAAAAGPSGCGAGGQLPGYVEGLSRLDFYAPHGYPVWGDL